MTARALSRRVSDPPTFSNLEQPSGSQADEQFFVSFGIILSCRLCDVEKIRQDIQARGGKLVFQTVSNGPLFLLRQGQIERIMQGDLTELGEIHRKKERRSEK